MGGQPIHLPKRAFQGARIPLNGSPEISLNPPLADQLISGEDSDGQVGVPDVDR
jgi:hypothetical protein